MENGAPSAYDDDIQAYFDFGAYDTHTVQPLGEHQGNGDWENETQLSRFQQSGSRNTMDQCARESEADEGEDDLPDAIDTARRNYRADNPLHFPSSFRHADESEVDDMVQTVNKGAHIGLFKERWEVDKESAEMLASIMDSLRTGHSSNWQHRSLTRLLHLRLDEPVLTCDPEAEMAAIFERNEVRLTADGITPLELDDDKDEGSKWPRKTLEIPKRVFDQIINEKWQLDKATGAYMKDIIRGLEGDAVDWLAKDREQRAVHQASPILIPPSPTLSPGRIPTPAANFQLTSTPEDPSVREAAELHAQLAEHDDLEMQEVVVTGTSHLDEYLDVRGTNTSLSVRHKVDTWKNLRCSSPVIEQQASESSESPLNKAKAITLHEENSAVVAMTIRDVLTDPETGAQEAAASMVEALEPLASPALARLKSEQLTEADTTMRVNVPHLIDDSHLEVVKTEKKWGGISKIEKKLLWSPFPSYLGKFKAEGDFDDGSCVRYLSELDFDGEVDTQHVVGKADGSRMLVNMDEQDALDHNHLSDEEEVESSGEVQRAKAISSRPLAIPNAEVTQKAQPLNQQERTTTAPVRTAHAITAKDARGSARLTIKPNGMPAVAELLRKRRAQLERDELEEKRQKQRAMPVGDPYPNTHDTEHRKSAQTAEQRQFDHTNHLNQFLTLQGQLSAEELSRRNYKNSISAYTTDRETTALVSTTREQVPPIDILEGSQPRFLAPLPASEIRKGESMQVILSPAIMTNHQLVRKLQGHLPNIEMIVRELGAGDYEADFTISPSTGLTSTSLQQLKQKALPGHTSSHFGIRERIALVASRYERLIVLVSEGRQALAHGPLEIHGLDERDAAALAEFIGLTVLFRCEVQVTFVPGGDEALVRWIAAILSRYAPHVQDIPLLHEETYWERFLRAAGFNTYAAQALLVQLKSLSSPGHGGDGGLEGQGNPNPFSSSSSPPSCTLLPGLAAFVGMSEEERVQRFARVLGGDRMLRRASRVLDRRW